MPPLRTASHGQEIVHTLPLPAASTRAKSHASRLGWNLLDEAEGRLVFRTRTSWRSWGEVVTVVLRESRLTVESRCSLSTQVVDWGKNRHNCEALAAGLVTGSASGPRLL